MDANGRPASISLIGPTECQLHSSCALLRSTVGATFFLSANWSQPPNLAADSVAPSYSLRLLYAAESRADKGLMGTGAISEPDVMAYL